MSQQSGTPHALVVVDSLTVRMDLGEALSNVGFTVTPCGTAAFAREEWMPQFSLQATHRVTDRAGTDPQRACRFRHVLLTRNFGEIRELFEVHLNVLICCTIRCNSNHLSNVGSGIRLDA